MFTFLKRPVLAVVCLFAPCLAATEAMTHEAPVASETIAKVRNDGPYSRKYDADCKADEMRMAGWYASVYRMNGYWWVKARR